MVEGIRSIKQDYQTGLLNYAMAQTKMEQTIRKAYYDMLLAQENIAIQRESFANAERQVTMAQANYNNGLVPQLTLLQAQVSRDNLKPAIDQAETNFKLAMANFAMNLGLEYDTQFELVPVTGDLTYVPLDVKELVTKAANGKPEIMELRQQLLTLTSQRKAQALGFFTPYLRFGFDYSPTFLGLWDNMDDTDFWNGHDSGIFSVTLGISLNSLFPFTKQGQGLKDFDNNIKAATIGLAQRIQGSEIEVYNTVLSLQRMQITAETLAQTVELADRSYRLTEEAYRAGLQELFSVQNADLARSQARLQMLSQQFDYLKGLIDLEYSIGVPFGTLSNGGNTK
jgi:outer membrane protein TolC